YATGPSQLRLRARPRPQGPARPRQLRGLPGRPPAARRGLRQRGRCADPRPVRARLRLERRPALPDDRRARGQGPRRTHPGRRHAAGGGGDLPDQPLQPGPRGTPDAARSARLGLAAGRAGLRARLERMRVRFWGTRGSIPVGLTVADVRDKLARALLSASGRTFGSYGEALGYVQQVLPGSLGHTYGGHSSCVELDLGSDEYFVCDMGSGARPFGAHVLARQGGRPATVHVFMSHMHWDHIMGFPFFGLAYVPKTRLRIYGCHDELELAFRRQQDAPSFPVPFSALGADIQFIKLAPGRAQEVS